MSDLDDYVSARRKRDVEVDVGYEQGLADLSQQLSELVAEGEQSLQAGAPVDLETTRRRLIEKYGLQTPKGEEGK